MSYIEHPLIKEGTVEKRLFQLDLAVSALQESTLVVLPTGLGKTVVALLVILVRLDRGKVLFMAPTRPLVEQHTSFLKNVLVAPSVVVQFTGETPPERRREMWDEARIIVSTPQVIENDLLSRRISLRDVSCVIFDEAHRATGNYAYVYIAQRYEKEGRDGLVLGITASPGSSAEKIEEICSNLRISRVEAKTDQDPDVVPFVHQTEVEVVKVTVPKEILQLRNLLEDVLEQRVEALSRLDPSGGTTKQLQRASKKELLDMQKRLRTSIAREPTPSLYQAVSVLAEVLKLKHAVELAETQGTESLAKYLERLDMEARSRGGSKAAKRIAEDPRFREAVYTLERLDVDHPKLMAVKDLVEEQLKTKDDSLIMVFTNYRDTATSVLEFLEGSGEGQVRPVRFVGQASRASDAGLTQKQQTEILQQFREGTYNVLIATSVGEEGIDIPATDMVLFYEPVPSEIRSIQRKGRTGRARAGRVVVLVARGTKDEAYRWISDRKEKDMHRQIQDLGRFEIATAEARQTQIGSVGVGEKKEEEVGAERVEEKKENGGEEASALVYVDSRERTMAKRLEALGIDIVLEVLEVGDYVISDRVAIERKTAADFVDSLVGADRDLFRQVGDLTRTYERPLLILEGRDLYARHVNPNPIRGALVSLAEDVGISIHPTEDEEATASVSAWSARREQEGAGREPSVHGRKTARTLKEQQEDLISSIPGVGAVVARNLLKHFGSVEKVATAPPEALQEVELVGPKTAERIREVVGGEYKG